MALLHIKTYSLALKTKTNIEVILPTPLPSEQGDVSALHTYYGGEKKYPVLYLLHGTYGDECDWQRFSRIESYAQEYNVAVVMPNVGNSSYRDVPRGGPGYYTYIAEELPLMMQGLFPISDKREDNFIAGLSMGGNGAFKIGMGNPNRFGYVACLSGGYQTLNKKITADPDSVWAYAFSPDEKIEGTMDDLYWLASRAVQNKNCPSLYLCCGTNDFLYEENQSFKKYLDSIGLSYEYHEQPGSHNFEFWDAEIKRILEWLPINPRHEEAKGTPFLE